MAGAMIIIRTSQCECVCVCVCVCLIFSFFFSVCPVGSCSLAGVDVDRFDAGLALDVAAPVELALAALLDGRLVRVVAPAAAHQIAAVHAGRSPVARPTVRP